MVSKNQFLFEDAKILLVDDVLKNLQILANIFNDTKAKISFAMNGKQAVDQAEAFMPDLILLDISMPVMDGITACERIKANPITKDIPIIFLTAKTETEDIVKGLSLGAADYITKPFQAAELLARVKTHVELARTRRNLLAANQEMLGLIKMRDRMLSIIAHDLRGPLGNLNQLLEMLPSDPELEEELVDLCRTSASEAFNLLENLLNWAKRQYKEVKVNKAVVDIYSLINNVIKTQKSAIQRKKLNLEIGLDEGHTAFCDESMMDIVIRNLLSNAIKFTPLNGSIRIHTEQRDGMLSIFIADTGIGMSEDVKSKIFESKEYHSTLGTAKERGSGLGLMICKEFTERNNGTIHVVSEAEKGSTFSVVIPALADGC